EIYDRYLSDETCTDVTYKRSIMNQVIQKITTEAVFDIVKSSRGKVVDIRPLAAYNGWQLQNEARGGHIKSAKSIPLRWTRYMDWVEVLEEKNIREDEPVVIYGYENDGTWRMAEQLADLDRKSTRLNSSHVSISYAVFCLK